MEFVFNVVVVLRGRDAFGRKGHLAIVRAPRSLSRIIQIPDLTGGDPKRGEEAYFGKEALCSQCHVVKGRGDQVGPDLGECLTRPYVQRGRGVDRRRARLPTRRCRGIGCGTLGLGR